MIARRRMPSWLGEVVFGFCMSLVAAAVAATLSFVLPAPVVARLVVAGLGLTLVLRTIAGSAEKTGRIVVIAVWCAVAAGVWMLGAGVAVYVIVHVTLVWLVRSLYSYTRLLEAGLDLGLTSLALSFAVFAAVRTESVFLAAWCFLLLHAFRVSIPGVAARLTTGTADEIPTDDPNRGFAEARKAADEALQRIAGTHHSAV